MITMEAVGLAINIATGILKLANRVDLILAEREAVEAPLALPQAPVRLAPPQAEMVQALRKLLKDETGDPDPLEEDRAAIETLLKQASPATAELFRHVRRHLPALALGTLVDLDQEFIVELRKRRPDFPLDQRDVRIAAYYLAAGTTPEGRDYTWRIALTVVDALAEFGSGNAALFTHNPKMQGIVASVLKRFAEADLQTATSWEGLLKKAVGATLNGALDSRSALSHDRRWLETVLDALATAKGGVSDGQKDDFLLGLLSGEGYPRLVGTLLEATATRVSQKHTKVFGQIASELLQQGGGLIKEAPGFEDFFHEHWADLLQAGFKSLDAHGAAIVEGKSPLLGKVLLATTKELAEAKDLSTFNEETLLSLVDTAVHTVAASPEDLLKKGEPWMEALVGSVAGVLADQGLRGTFSAGGLESIVKKALGTFGEHPEILVAHPGLVQDLVGSVLTSVSKKGSFAVADLADAAVTGALDGIGRRPDLLPLKYADFVADVAGRVSALVEKSSLSKLQGRDLIGAVLAAAEENPPLFLAGKVAAAQVIVDVVLQAASGQAKSLLGGEVLTDVVEAVLRAFARGAQRKLDEVGTDAGLSKELLALLQAGLARAVSELGHTMSLETLPETLGLLVVAWLRGTVGVVDPDDTGFRRLFSDLAERAAA